MQFETRFRRPVAEGAVTLTFRRWKRPQVLAGNTYRTAAGRLVVDAIRVVEPSTIADAEAVLAGYPSAAALLADLRGEAGLPVYRVDFHVAPAPDPRELLAAGSALSEADFQTLTARLDRLDRASAIGLWTLPTLALIAANPAVRAGDLAPRLGQELQPFKLNVRKLKNLGLTISLETGYRLSPRGEAFLERSR